VLFGVVSAFLIHCGTRDGGPRDAPSAEAGPGVVVEDAAPTVDGALAPTDGGVIALPDCGVTTPPPDELTHVHIVMHDGQTFVLWPDHAQGDAGIGYRYDVYRRTDGPITAANLGSSQVIARGMLNNSAKLFGTAFLEAQRVDPSLPTATIVQDGGPLPMWSGVTVHTAKDAACAYYAVIATDTAGTPVESVVAGQTATTVPTAEAPAPRAPIKIYDAKDRGPYWQQTAPTGKTGLPITLLLHASNAQGGGAGAYGDYFLYFGDESNGYQDGLPGVFSVRETNTEPIDRLVIENRDTVVAPNGVGGVETYWFGYASKPLWAPPNTPAFAYPFTEHRLLWITNYAVTRYQADPLRVTCSGGSMGAWGSMSFCFHHPELFAAILADRPRMRQTTLPSLIDPLRRDYLTATTNPAVSTVVMDDGVTSFLDRTDSVAFVTNHPEADELPYLVWGIGRQDGFSAWQPHLDMVRALKASHRGFVFAWNNGDHSTTVGANLIAATPVDQFALNRSYPAFANSSIDSDLGDGDPASGDLTGGINLGFSWSNVVDQNKTWAATLSNSVATTVMTVDVTPRRAQEFKLQSGTVVTWSSSTGDKGTATADAAGLVTITGLRIPLKEAVTLTVTAPP
jgi:hypothetical protein